MRNVFFRKEKWLLRKYPFSRVFGNDRGNPIDRHLIELFLASHSNDIKCKVLEIGDDQYTYKFGNNLTNTAILAGPIDSLRSQCYPLGDLTDEHTLKNVDKYNCVIATNVLNFIYDINAAVRGLATLVQPNNGCVLVTVAGLAQISRVDYNLWGDYWRLNDMSVRKLFETCFETVEITTYGNAPLAAAFIMGLAEEEVPSSLFKLNDSDFQIVIAVKASTPKLRLN